MAAELRSNKTLYHTITSSDAVPDDEGPDPFKISKSYFTPSSVRTKLPGLPSYRAHYLPSPSKKATSPIPIPPPKAPPNEKTKDSLHPNKGNKENPRTPEKSMGTVRTTKSPQYIPDSVSAFEDTNPYAPDIRKHDQSRSRPDTLNNSKSNHRRSPIPHIPAKSDSFEPGDGRRDFPASDPEDKPLTSVYRVPKKTPQFDLPTQKDPNLRSAVKKPQKSNASLLTEILELGPKPWPGVKFNGPKPNMLTPMKKPQKSNPSIFTEVVEIGPKPSPKPLKPKIIPRTGPPIGGPKPGPKPIPSIRPDPDPNPAQVPEDKDPFPVPLPEVMFVVGPPPRRRPKIDRDKASVKPKPYNKTSVIVDDKASLKPEPYNKTSVIVDDKASLKPEPYNKTSVIVDDIVNSVTFSEKCKLNALREKTDKYYCYRDLLLGNKKDKNQNEGSLGSLDVEGVEELNSNRKAPTQCEEIRERSQTPRPFEQRPQRPSDESVSVVDQDKGKNNENENKDKIFDYSYAPAFIPYRHGVNYDKVKSRIYVPTDEVRFPCEFSNVPGKMNNENYAYGEKGFVPRNRTADIDTDDTRNSSEKTSEKKSSKANKDKIAANFLAKKEITSALASASPNQFLPKLQKPVQKDLKNTNQEDVFGRLTNKKVSRRANRNKNQASVAPANPNSPNPRRYGTASNDNASDKKYTINKNPTVSLNLGEKDLKRSEVSAYRHELNSAIAVASEIPLPTEYYFRQEDQLPGEEPIHIHELSETDEINQASDRGQTAPKPKGIYADYLSRSGTAIRQGLDAETLLLLAGDKRFVSQEEDFHVIPTSRQFKTIMALEKFKSFGKASESLNECNLVTENQGLLEKCQKKQCELPKNTTCSPSPAQKSKGVQNDECLGQGQDQQLSSKHVKPVVNTAPPDIAYVGLGSKFWDVENAPRIVWNHSDTIKERKVKNIFFSDIPDDETIPYFRYPLNVHEVHFDGKISPENFFHVLIDLQELRTLEIHVSTLHHLTLDKYSAKQTIKLPKLKSLEISCNSFDENDAVSYNLVKIVKNVIVLLSLYYPSITYIGVALPFVATMERKLMLSLWIFIKNHCTTLEIFNTECPFPEPARPTSPTPNKFQTLVPPIDPDIVEMDLTGAQQVKLVSFHLFYWHQVGSTEFWRRFVKTQDKLEYIQFWVEGPVYYKFPYDVIKNNQVQLVTVSMNLDIRSYPDRYAKVPIDFNAFENAAFLKTIALKGIQLGHVRPNDLLKPDIINVDHLPKSVELIKLMNLNVTSQDIDKIVLDFPSLKVLYLDNVGTQGNLGITVDALVLLLEKRNNILEQIEIFNSINQKSLLSSKSSHSFEDLNSNDGQNPSVSNKQQRILGYRLLVKILSKKQEDPSFRAYRTMNNDFEIIYEDDEEDENVARSTQRRRSHDVDDSIDFEIKTKSSVHGKGTRKLVSSVFRSEAVVLVDNHTRFKPVVSQDENLPKSDVSSVNNSTPGLPMPIEINCAKASRSNNSSVQKLFVNDVTPLETGSVFEVPMKRRHTSDIGVDTDKELHQDPKLDYRQDDPDEECYIEETEGKGEDVPHNHKGRHQHSTKKRKKDLPTPTRKGNKRLKTKKRVWKR